MMTIIYYITLPIIFGISLLPFSVLRVTARVMHWFIYKIFRYRTDVVSNNLKNAFPEKSDQEIQSIQDKFYRYFCELVLETIKTLTISRRSLKKHVVFGDISIFESFFEKKQSIIIVMGHLGNWELAGARFSQSSLHQLYVIYHPLAHKGFNDLVYHMRTRLGNKLYAMKDAFRGMIRDKEDITATAFIADQTPFPKGAYWTTFLNQDTPIFVGPAKIAKKLNYPIVYVSVKRLRPSYYEIYSELLVEHPELYTIEEISECYTRRLEKDIIANPETWLWTHRRWKHKRQKNDLSLPYGEK